MDVAELLSVETSVLRTFCLTANSDGSELKKRIVDLLVEEDFYFPITKSVFSTIEALTEDGANVDAESLTRALNLRSVDVPDDFFLEDLFVGEAPASETLTGWIVELKADEDTPPLRDETTTPSAKLAKTHPSVKATTPAPRKTKPKPEQEPAAVSEPAPPKPTAETQREPSAQDVTSAVEGAPAAAPPSREVLAPESGEWLGYLAELTKKQGEHLKTGFAGLDTEWGGLGPGLLLLAGEQQDQLLDFLKQLVDQIASRCRVPCLYLSFERSKAELRLQTLSRLSRASSESIQSGRYDKDSEEWQNIIRAGEQAVEWLQRIYVVEPTAGTAVTRIRELRQGLIGSGAGASCLIAVDNLEKLASRTDLLQSVAELKELAESLGIVVIGVASNAEIVHEKSADMAAAFSTDNDHSVLEVLTPGASPKQLRFTYDPETHRFEEARPSGLSAQKSNR